MKTIDREMSWLDFNHRCLHMASRKDIPLLERVNFLGITYSNMAEFIAVRFSAVVEGFVSSKKVSDDLHNSNYDEKYENLLKGIKAFKKHQIATYQNLKRTLHKELGVDLIDDYKNLSKKEAAWVDDYFDREIIQVLAPVTYDSSKELPIMGDAEIQFLVKLSDKTGKHVVCLMSVPSHIRRIVKISEKRFIFVEQIIEKNLHRLFVGKKVEDSIQFQTFKFVQNMDTNDTEFVVDKVRKYLSDRDYSNNNIFLDIHYRKKSELWKVLYKIFDVYKRHTFVTKSPIGLECLKEKFYSNQKYEFSPFKSQPAGDLITERGIFDYLSREDIMLHHPYESFSTVIDFIREAAKDDDVISIKQTLYRVASKSKLIDALCEASRRGKKVVIMLELKARFDERRNVELIETLKEAGCTLVYGVPDLKVHAKMCLVTRRWKKGVKIFSHVGTGNYNESTAKGYTDISYMTSNDKIGKDLNDIFNMISGFSVPSKIHHVYFSPGGIRKQIYSLIDREIHNVKKGKKSHVVLKMNSLCDYGMIKKIYEAAEKGVKLHIICRGICSLVARKNITVKSVVGRFLEHSRIYYFENGGHPEIMIASSDLMTRNLDHRVELLIPIKDAACKKKLINILHLTWEDEKNTYWMKNNGNYAKDKGKKDVHHTLIKKSISALKASKRTKW